MATKKYTEMQDLKMDELVSELAETENQYKNLKFDHAVKGLDNPLILREIRRDIARLRTEIRRREIAEMDGSALALRSKKRARRK